LYVYIWRFALLTIMAGELMIQNLEVCESEMSRS
jgi:hypothetical protein